MDFPFRAANVPRWWFYESPLATHVANGLNLLFPKGERFFVRSVRHYLPRIEDPALRARVQGFFGQEGLHAREHERFFDILREQGFELDEWLAWYDHVAYDLVEKNASPALRLAVTAAAEHFTATFAERALSMDFLDNAHPVVRDLLRWHAAEEIEHKSVAFDVLETVDPSYALRLAGLAVATLCLAGFWISATRMLVAQEPAEARARAVRELRRRGPDRPGIFDGTMRRAFLAYARPGFHPSQMKNEHLAEAYLEKIGRAYA
jgi:predicted metal-dependent hydrolase